MSKFDVTDTFAPCPRCSCPSAKRVNMLLLIGPLGDVLFHPVKCINCGKVYNGKTGEPNFLAMLVFPFALIAIGIFIWLFLQ